MAYSKENDIFVLLYGNCPSLRVIGSVVVVGSDFFELSHTYYDHTDGEVRRWELSPTFD